MPSVTALIALAENGYTITDITAINVEYIIDNAIDYVNLLAETSIAALSGTAGTKTVTVTREQNAPLRILITCMLREAKKTSLSNSSSTNNSSGTTSSIGVGVLSVSESSSVSAAISAASSFGGTNDLTRVLFDKAIERLRRVENELQVFYG
jgi:hypothetical protein